MSLSRFSIGVTIFLVALLAFVVVFAPSSAIALQTTETPMAPSAGTTPAAAPPASALMVTQNATLGNYVTDSSGRTLYIFTKDTSGVSNCTGSCAQTWLPFTGQAMSPSAPSAAGTSSAETTPSASGTTAAQMNIDPTMLAMITRSDGTSQVTFNGHPLYYYSGDTNPGDAKGQGIAGNWFVIDPTGNPIQTSGSNAPSGSSTSAAPSGTTTP